jgi:hypothetical protein
MKDVGQALEYVKSLNVRVDFGDEELARYLLLRFAHGVPDDIFCVDVGCKARASNVSEAEWVLLVFLEAKLLHACHATPHLRHTVYILKNSLNVADLWACCENELQAGRALVEVELILVRLVEFERLFAAGTGAIGTIQSLCSESAQVRDLLSMRYTAKLLGAFRRTLVWGLTALRRI